MYNDLKARIAKGNTRYKNTMKYVEILAKEVKIGDKIIVATGSKEIVRRIEKVPSDGALRLWFNDGKCWEFLPGDPVRKCLYE